MLPRAASRYLQDIAVPAARGRVSISGIQGLGMQLQFQDTSQQRSVSSCRKGGQLCMCLGSHVYMHYINLA